MIPCAGNMDFMEDCRGYKGQEQYTSTIRPNKRTFNFKAPAKEYVNVVEMVDLPNRGIGLSPRKSVGADLLYPVTSLVNNLLFITITGLRVGTGSLVSNQHFHGGQGEVRILSVAAFPLNNKNKSLNNLDLHEKLVYNKLVQET